jgi:hypothetical protein
MNLLSLGSVLNIYCERRENANCLHVSTYRQLARAALRPSLRCRKAGQVFCLNCRYSINYSIFLLNSLSSNRPDTRFHQCRLSSIHYTVVVSKQSASRAEWCKYVCVLKVHVSVETMPCTVVESVRDVRAVRYLSSQEKYLTHNVQGLQLVTLSWSFVSSLFILSNILCQHCGLHISVGMLSVF